MDTVRVKVTGVKETMAAIKKLGPAVERRVLPKAMFAGANEIVKVAREIAPRADNHWAKVSKKTGKQYPPLARSIRATRRRNAPAGKVVYAVHPGTAYWGLFLELGTSRMSKYPWLSPATSMAQDAAFNAAKKRMQELTFVEVARIAYKRSGG